MKIKKDDIVAVGIGIGRVVEINGDNADVAYLHQLEGEIVALEFPVKDLEYITMGRPRETMKAIVESGHFLEVIEKRDKELAKIKEANVKRALSKVGKRGVQSKEDKQMISMLKDLTPEQIKELFA